MLVESYSKSGTDYYSLLENLKFNPSYVLLVLTTSYLVLLTPSHRYGNYLRCIE